MLAEIHRQNEAHRAVSSAWWQAQAAEQAQKKAARKGNLGHDYAHLDAEYEREKALRDSDSSNDLDDDEDAELEPLEIELNPAPRGTRLELEHNVWWNMGTAQTHELGVLVACERCSLAVEVTLSGRFTPQNRLAKRCSKCKTILRAEFRPQLIFEGNNLLGYIDTDACRILDVLKLRLLATCLKCNEDVLFAKSAVRGQRVEANCHHCHDKLALAVTSFVITTFDDSGKEVQLPALGAFVGDGKGKSRKALAPQVMTEGRALPDNGACQHFRKSYRWYRWKCCGRAYPCPVCHELAGCEGAIDGVLANRQICGKCSREQMINNTACEACGANLKGKSSRGHWQGGDGARSLSRSLFYAA
ncbi:uncharacterized protein MONBRDRAFT_28460 [Monosiga brevicollis MX1]|uniref:CHY-type domain-containing protein n=1 Tax=Monosiga brevicollis TaxID=81824 RepID=A9V885_MONBE|nr:uncharacterized protein MONBRDRAFT_28460 [Monosiga brevicollis MX1]EDQ86295.1 predicted protein [Monosiga brevicollis MX1]|eukprot:XP_001748965.1 hypothetical protein [Monosiga brevicollis MX1]